MAAGNVRSSQAGQVVAVYAATGHTGRFVVAELLRRGFVPVAVRSNRTTTKPSEKGAATMKLTTTTHVSVDGVMQGLGGPDEDRRGGFERGGWAIPLFDDEAATFVDQVYQRADAFLIGRRTYEIFAGYWGAPARAAAAVEDPGSNPIAAALNTRPKYVASTTLTDPQPAVLMNVQWRRTQIDARPRSCLARGVGSSLV
jgi:dihydrofolate reductase